MSYVCFGFSCKLCPALEPLRIPCGARVAPGGHIPLAPATDWFFITIFLNAWYSGNDRGALCIKQSWLTRSVTTAGCNYSCNSLFFVTPRHANRTNSQFVVAVCRCTSLPTLIIMLLCVWRKEWGPVLACWKHVSFFSWLLKKKNKNQGFLRRQRQKKPVSSQLPNVHP